MSTETLELKLKGADKKLHVDVAIMINTLYLDIQLIGLLNIYILICYRILGGLVPENTLNTSILDGLFNAGVLGVKVAI
ncbi:hypothetical protein PIB30_054804 [Stylosanthes scabra]|uniref:Uncharacterized protein n=1 Tax=Stylosanthes scabra TaxID=79078 RepID=A0ABU6VLB0_9FABA|nr:hypothetical protein [Stylosanthes scabra]